MTELTTFEFTDLHNLTDPEVLNVIKELCEFDNIIEPFLIDIVSKSHYHGKIEYKIKIYDLSTAT